MSDPIISLIPKSPAEVAKAILYIAITALAIFRTSLAAGLDLIGILAIIIAIVGLIPVYLLTGTLVKTVTAFALAALQALVLVVGPGLGLGDVTIDSWIGVLLAAFAAIGIAVVPNKPMIDARVTGRITSLPE